LGALAAQLRALDEQVRLCVPPDFQVWIARAANPPASRHSSIFLNTLLLLA
jgi:hypothetical protein